MKPGSPPLSEQSGPPLGVCRREDEARLAGDELAIVVGERRAPEALGDAVGEAPRVDAVLKLARALVEKRQRRCHRHGAG